MDADELPAALTVIDIAVIRRHSYDDILIDKRR